MGIWMRICPKENLKGSRENSSVVSFGTFWKFPKILMKSRELILSNNLKQSKSGTSLQSPSFFHVLMTMTTWPLPQQLGKTQHVETSYDFPGNNNKNYKSYKQTRFEDITKKPTNHFIVIFYSDYLKSSAEGRRPSQQGLVQYWVFCCEKT